MRRSLALLATLLTTAIAVGVGAPTGASAAAPCGTLPLSSTNYTHVVWIWMENHSYGEIIGSSEAPYINALAGECGLATNYHNVDHPSLPNYVAATSGLPFGELKRFEPDCNPSHKCSTAAESIFTTGRSKNAQPRMCPTRNCPAIWQEGPSLRSRS